jgi:hypothetical protein
MRSLRIVGLVVVVAGLVLGAAQAGSGLAATSPVVPVGGKVAGKGYAYYLKQVWLTNFGASALPPSCSTLTVGGQKVAVLRLPPKADTCNEPAGRAIYVHEVTFECSTLKGDHNGFGTTNADLVKCAKDFINSKVTYSATLDGQTVDLHALDAATGEFFVPKVVGQSAPTARSAAYGPGILLLGLSKGTHTIVSKANIPGVEKVNSTLKVRVG